MSETNETTINESEIYPLYDIREDLAEDTTTMFAIIDTDGARLVVWGIGATEEEARADAREQECYEETGLVQVREIDAIQVEQVLAGNVWPFSDGG